MVGVPVTIHFLSMLRAFEHGLSWVDVDDDTWPSSMTRRFQRIWRRGETSGTAHWQSGTELPGNSGHTQYLLECSFAVLPLDSAVNRVYVMRINWGIYKYCGGNWGNSELTDVEVGSQRPHGGHVGLVPED